MQSIQIDIADWTAEQSTNWSQSLGLSPDKLIRELVCSNARGFDPLGARHFAVPSSIVDLFPSERFMVVGRQDESVTLTPTDYVPFEQPLKAFRANGLNEDQVSAT